MGKLVIRSSTVNEAYTINYDSQETFVNASVKSGKDKHRKLIITSKNGFVILTDFLHLNSSGAKLIAGLIQKWLIK